MNMSKSAMDKWVRQLKQERRGIAPKAVPFDARANRNHKKVTALLMSDSLNNSRYLETQTDL